MTDVAIKTTTVQAIPAVGYNDFRDYLEQSLRNPFVLDMAGFDLRTVIESCIAIKRNISPRYGKTLSSLLFNIKYIEQMYRVKIYPVQVTDIFWEMFIGILQNRGLKMSTIMTISNELRAVLRWAQRYNAKLSPSFDVIRIPPYRSQEIALTADDVSHIYHFDVQLFYRDRRPQFRKRMEQVRDMFVLSCNLYQRHSDMVRIDRTCFNRNMFQITQQKTGNVAKVDMDKYCIDSRTVYEILEKYNYEAPYKGDISNFNHYLKVLMEDVGLTEEVRLEEKVSGVMVTTSTPRYKMISSHTARRTAITLAMMRGVSMHEIKKCSGHASLNMVERYIKD